MDINLHLPMSKPLFITIIVIPQFQFFKVTNSHTIVIDQATRWSASRVGVLLVEEHRGGNGVEQGRLILSELIFQFLHRITLQTKATSAIHLIFIAKTPAAHPEFHSFFPSANN